MHISPQTATRAVGASQPIPATRLFHANLRLLRAPFAIQSARAVADTAAAAREVQPLAHAKSSRNPHYETVSARASYCSSKWRLGPCRRQAFRSGALPFHLDTISRQSAGIPLHTFADSARRDAFSTANQVISSWRPRAPPPGRSLWNSCRFPANEVGVMFESES